MRSQILILSLVFLGCVYDPPLKGREIYIHNQTDKYVFVTNSLPSSGFLLAYDTFRVNSRILIGKKGQYIAGYDDWVYFFSKTRYDFLKTKKVQKDTLYFIQETDIRKPWNQLRDEIGYKIFEFDIEEVEKSKLNHIFYYGDSILLSHEYNMTTLK